jgi:hypothetical protein
MGEGENGWASARTRPHQSANADFVSLLQRLQSPDGRPVPARERPSLALPREREEGEKRDSARGFTLSRLRERVARWSRAG